MSETVIQAISSLEHLNPKERAEVAYALLLSIGPEDSMNEEEFDKELEQRFVDIRDGKEVGIPAEELYAELRENRK